MLIAIIIINILSLLAMALVLLAARRMFAKRRYLLCSLMHTDHSPQTCKDVPMKMGALGFLYVFLTAGVTLASFFIYLSA